MPPAFAGQALAETGLPTLSKKSCLVVPLLFKALGVIISAKQELQSKGWDV